MKLFQQQIKYENAIPSGFAFSPNEDHVFLHMEQVYTDLDRVCQAYGVVGAKNIHPNEIYLANHLLDQVKTITLSTVRFENNQTEVERLQLRCEGFLGKIKEKLVAFWKWMLDFFKKLFGRSGPPEETLSSSEIRELKNDVANIKSLTSTLTIDSFFGLERICGGGTATEMKNRLYVIQDNSLALSAVCQDLEAAIKELMSGNPENVTKLITDTFNEFVTLVGNTDSSTKLGPNNTFYLGLKKGYVINNDITSKTLSVVSNEVPNSFGDEITLTSNDIKSLVETIIQIEGSLGMVVVWFHSHIVPLINKVEKIILAEKSNDPVMLEATKKLTDLSGFVVKFMGSANASRDALAVVLKKISKESIEKLIEENKK